MSKGKNKEGNVYDRILKENINKIFLPLLEKYLNLKIVRTAVLDAKLQSTIEREVDFLRIVETADGDRFILHLEFQVKNEKLMIYRMKEYDAIIQRKYKMRVESYVIFLGEEKISMKSVLDDSEVFKKFDIINISTLDFNEMIESQIPEEIILAILTNFRGEHPERIIRSIINKLKLVSSSTSQLKKFIQQLGYLSKLRKLGEETTKIVENMAISYDIQDDYAYKKGKAKGEAIGIEKGFALAEQKKEAERRVIVIKMLSGGVSIEQIAHFFEVSIEYVESIKNDISDDA